MFTGRWAPAGFGCPLPALACHPTMPPPQPPQPRPAGPGPVVLLADAGPLTAEVVQVVSRGPRQVPTHCTHNLLRALSYSIRAHEARQDRAAAADGHAFLLRIAFIGALSGDNPLSYARVVEACKARLSRGGAAGGGGGGGAGAGGGRREGEGGGGGKGG